MSEFIWQKRWPPESQVICQMNVNSLITVKQQISLVCSHLSFSSFLAFSKRGAMISVMYEQVNLVKDWNDYDIQAKLTWISHFQVAIYLCFKTSPGAQTFIWKWIWYARQRTCQKKLISILKVVDQDSFWKRGKSSLKVANYGIIDLHKLFTWLWTWRQQQLFQEPSSPGQSYKLLY